MSYAGAAANSRVWGALGAAYNEGASVPVPDTPSDAELDLKLVSPDEALRITKYVPPHPPAGPDGPTRDDWERLREVLRSDA